MIKNKPKLKKRFQHGQVLLDLADSALQCLQPTQLVQSAVKLTGSVLRVQGKRYQLKQYKHVYVVGAGKATYGMAQGIMSLLGKRISGGTINVPVAHTKQLGKIQVITATHPFPDQTTVAGAAKILATLQHATADDLVICLMSGGGSSMLALPRPGITLAEKNSVVKQLMHASADIIELNTVRKHLSLTKGGQLAAATQADLLSLVISDVFGDQLDIIASGPTVADQSTCADAIAVLDKYKLCRDTTGKKIRHVIQQVETVKQLDPQRVFTTVIGNNQIALQLIAAQAKQAGITPLILTSFLRGEAKEVAQVLTSIAREVATYQRPMKSPALLIAGGETTVKVLGKGQGGRNQELVLAAVPFLNQQISILSLATDGVDGVTPIPVAGAVADGAVLQDCVVAGLNHHDYLHANDSFNCLKQLGCLLYTGPTGTNVGDIVLVLVK